MEAKRSSEKVRKFYENADAIRGTFKTAAEVLGDAFPVNYAYEVGDYNLVFVNMGGHGDQHKGFYQTANLMAVYPDGEIRSGNVQLEVRRYTTKWKFEQAKMLPAKEDEIIQYGPNLMANLYKQVYSEIKGKKDPDKISRMLAFLETEVETGATVLGLAQDAISEFDGIYSLGDETRSEAEDTYKILEDLFNGNETRLKTLPALKTAFELHAYKQDILHRYDELSADKDIDKIEAYTRNLVQKIAEDGLFPESNFPLNGKLWYPHWAERSIDPFVYCQRGRDKHWVISQRGDVRQAPNSETTSLKDNPVDLVDEAPRIMGHFVDKVVKSIYPHIGEKELPQPF